MALGSHAPARMIIRDVRVFDGLGEGTQDHVDVLVEGPYVIAVSTSPIAGDASDGVLEIDGSGRFLVPGLIDAHVHLMGNANTVLDFVQGSTGALYGNTIAEAKRMLLRGFTTVRDMGGDTAAVKSLIDDGAVDGPRIFPSQAIISQTSGHADFSSVCSAPDEFRGTSGRAEDVHLTRIADGVPRVLAAVRDQLRMGATQVALTLGGGASSGDAPQYTPDEIVAAVQAAGDHGTYVAAHVSTSAGVRRAVAAGVKSIEHGHLADEDTVKLLADSGVWLAAQPFAEDDHHYPDPARAAKNAEIRDGTRQLSAWAQKYGVRTAWGTDLLFEPDCAARQSIMAARLCELYGNAEALRMLTSGNAELLELAGERNSYREAKLGVIAEGAWADMILVEGDPLSDLTLIADPETNFRLIVKGGQIVKNTL